LDTPDLTNKDNRRLSVIKSNLGKKPEPIGVIIDDGGVNFGAAPQLPHTETVSDKAADLLLSLLADEPIRSKIIEDEFKQAGLSWRAKDNAKKKLKIVTFKKNDGWYWSLPAYETGDE
jgi:hypothetical protein